MQCLCPAQLASVFCYHLSYIKCYCVIQTKYLIYSEIFTDLTTAWLF